MKLEKVGMRTIKTSIGVGISILLGGILVQNPLFTAMACIISMQDTVKGSLKSGMNRIKGTVLGGVIGFLIALINPGGTILGGIGIMMVIHSCNIFKMKTSVVVSSVTFLSIHLGVSGYNPVIYSTNRVIDTSIGVVIGVLVNYLIARPNYEGEIKNQITSTKNTAKKLLEGKVIKKKEIDLKELRMKIQRLDEMHSKLLDELDYSRNEIDINSIEKELIECREIYFHMQSIELLEQKLYINKANKERLMNLYSKDLNWELSEDKSPVFNYHLYKIIESIQEI